ncbi:hypothetical protein PG990_000899 [Apiospora arundinis]|uniref:6-hydroxy-d-nicotine oxidase n=1 Tax=Apiospora arundinis TaxID=335852 RepID=A0ABR2I167_9PEZI
MKYISFKFAVAAVLNVAVTVIAITSNSNSNMSDSLQSTNGEAGAVRCADSTCDLLETAGVKVLRPNSAGYNAREAEYYSKSARMSPSCIVQPKSAQEVSKLIKHLVTDTTSNWAVRCGGHTAWGPAADIHDGVTIDLGLMNQTEYDEETKTAKIQGGSLWQDVYSTLEKHGVTVPGGRTSSVGVGGFILGGGNNFFSSRVGFACDNIVNYEIVLSNGELTNANANENADLWKALKGGSSNFGIVTRFDMRAFAQGDLYGGLITHPLNATDRVLGALSNYVERAADYQAGSVFSFWSYIRGASESVIISALHDATGTVGAPAFAEFAAIEPRLSSSLRTASHLNMTEELYFEKGFRNVWFAHTVVNDPAILKFITEQHNAFIKSWKAEVGDDSFSLYTPLQPMPSVLFAHGAAQGDGNVLGMNATTMRGRNCILHQAFLVFEGSPELEAEARRRMTTYRETVKRESVRTATDVDFEYLNYADKTQNPLRTYGADNVAFMRSVAAKYDPEGTLRRRMPGGFKIPEEH